jgi:O-antigen ligase
MVARRPALDRRALATYGLLLTSFTLSTLLAQDSHKAFGRWLDFTLYSLACWPVIAAVKNAATRWRLIDALAMFATLSIVVLYVAFLAKVGQPGFVPELQMREDNLPLLLPFVLTYVHRRIASPRRELLAGIAIALVAAYVIVSNGRAALFGLVAGLIVYGLLAIDIRKRVVFAIVALILVATVAVRGTYLLRGASTQHNIAGALNSASNFRLELWHNALTHPPENIWLGSGMGNIPDVVLTVHGAQAANLKHLHNFLLDCGYENGIVGLGILLLILSAGFCRALRAWRAGDADTRLQIGTLLAASAAIMVAALFSFSYGSKQFALYLFAFLGVAAMTCEPKSAPARAATDSGITPS